MILQNGRISRGAGFCVQMDCIDYHKGVFLLDHKGQFFCSRCRKLGKKVMEYGVSDNDTSLDFWQVRLEYGYDIETDSYRSIVIISDEEMPKEGNRYTLYNPLLKTDKRAILTAEALLGTLMMADSSIFAKGYIPTNMTINLDFDQPLTEVKSRLEDFSNVIKQSRLRAK